MQASALKIRKQALRNVNINVKKGFANEDGPVGLMLKEHAQGRDCVAQMAESIDNPGISGFNSAAIQYRDLLRKQIDKKNNVLFIMAD